MLDHPSLWAVSQSGSGPAPDGAPGWTVTRSAELDQTDPRPEWSWLPRKGGDTVDVEGIDHAVGVNEIHVVAN